MGIKDVLKEELINSLRMEKDYAREIEILPRGSLVRKRIKGRYFYYLVLRDGDKVKTLYKGRLSHARIQQYKAGSKKRRRLKKQLSRIKKQIRYLRSVLRGRYNV